MTATSL